MNEASGRLGRARFLRLGWFRDAVAVPAVDTSLHGSRARILIGGNDVSSNFKTFELSRKTETKETTQLGQFGKTFLPGNQEAKLPFEGYIDPQFHSSLRAIEGSPTTWAYSPAGTITGRTTYSGTATLKLHDAKSPSTEANAFSGELEVVGSITVTTAA